MITESVAEPEEDDKAEGWFFEVAGMKHGPFGSPSAARAAALAMEAPAPKLSAEEALRARNADAFERGRAAEREAIGRAPRYSPYVAELPANPEIGIPEAHPVALMTENPSGQFIINPVHPLQAILAGIDFEDRSRWGEPIEDVHANFENKLGCAPVEALAPTLGDAIQVARGCVDYGGGYRDGRELAIFHHGIGTVVRALEALRDQGGRDAQVAALARIGREIEAEAKRPSDVEVCLAHLEAEPCPTCASYVAAGL